MIVDSSAILAILNDEPDASPIKNALADASVRRMSVANALEVTIVAESRGGAAAAREFDRLMSRAAIELVPVTLRQLARARLAWRRFGKGNHPAALHFGDCFAYALADVRGEPLLFKGDDFARTDIEAA